MGNDNIYAIFNKCMNCILQANILSLIYLNEQKTRIILAKKVFL